MPYDFIVEFRSIDDSTKIIKRYSIPGGVDINDAWYEVLQYACRDCKKSQVISSIYYSKF